MATVLDYNPSTNSLSISSSTGSKPVIVPVAGSGIDNNFSVPQTFNGTINQSPGAGVSNQSPFLQASDMVSDYIVSGINPGVPSPASLTMTIPAGTAFVLGQRTLLQAAVADTYPASSDTYFSMTNTGQVAYTSVANGAAAPAAPANAINLLKVVTSPIGYTQPSLMLSTAAGSLAAGTYEYQVIAYDATGYGLAPLAVITTASTGEIVLTWVAPLNAISYDVYGRIPGSLGLLASGITALTFTDDGSITPGAAAPTVATSNAIQSITPLVDVGVNAALHGSVIGDHVAEGMLIPVPLPASLTASLNPGQAWVGGSFIELDAGIANTYAANSDTYVYLDAAGNLIYQAVPTGQSPLIAPPGTLLLAKVETYPATPPVVVPAPATSAGTLPLGTYGYAAVRHDATGYSLAGAIASVALALTAPTPTLAASTAAGTLVAGTYTYGLVAHTATGYSLLGTTDAITTTATGEVVLTWAFPADVTSVDVYGRVAGSLGLLASGITATTWTDDGSVTVGAAAPTVATATGEFAVYWTPAINETSIDIYRTAAGGSVLGLLVSGATGGVYTDTGAVTPGAAPATTATSNAVQRVGALAPIYPDAASSTIGQWNPENAVMIWVGDSTTEQLGSFPITGQPSGFNTLNNQWRAQGAPLEKLLGVISFGSSGVPFYYFLSQPALPGFGPSGPLPGINQGPGVWDYYGHKPAGAASLATCLAQRNTLPSSAAQVVWVLCYGINDVILNNSYGYMTQENIADYIENSINITVKAMLRNNPADIVILRMPNTMTSRPYVSSAGFPNASMYPTYGLNDTIDAALFDKWNKGLAQGYIQAQAKNPRTIMVDMRPYFGYSSEAFTSIPQGAQTASSTIDANIMLGNQVHPSNSTGQVALVNRICAEAVKYTSIKNIPISYSNDIRIKADTYINEGYTGNPWDIDPYYFDDNPDYTNAGSFVIASVTANSMTILNPSKKLRVFNILNGSILYARIGVTEENSRSTALGYFHSTQVSFGQNTGVIVVNGLSVPAWVASGGFARIITLFAIGGPLVDANYLAGNAVLNGYVGGNTFNPTSGGATYLSAAQSGLLISDVSAKGAVTLFPPSSGLKVGANFTITKSANASSSFIGVQSNGVSFLTPQGVVTAAKLYAPGTSARIVYDGTYWVYTTTGTTVNPTSLLSLASTSTAGAITVTAAQLVGGYLADGATQTAAFTVTTDTAVNILAAMPNAIVGTSFKWRFINNDQSATGYAGTLAGGTRVTIGTILPNPAVPKGGYEDYVFTFTAIGSTPTLTVEAVGGSSAALL